MIFIPKKINVGVHYLKDTYTGKLAFVLYYDEKGKLHSEKARDGWHNYETGKDGTDEPPVDYDNEPMDGFVLNKKVGGYDTGWNHRNTYTRIYDPRGFEFEITIENLLWILENCDCIKGKGLDGQFVYGWDGKNLLLVPVDSPDYKEIAKKNEIIHNNEFLKAKDLKVGYTYETLDGGKYVYMGKSKAWDCCGEKQDEKSSFFFINLNGKFVETMKTINKKFTNMVSNSFENYIEYTDILNRSPYFSPIDDSKDKIVDLPFENFSKWLTDENKSWYSIGIRDIDNENNVISLELNLNRKENKYYTKYKDVEEYEVVPLWSYKKEKRTRKVTKYKYYDSIEDAYNQIKPVYRIKYLANGYEYEKEYYYGTEE